MAVDKNKKFDSESASQEVAPLTQEEKDQRERVLKMVSKRGRALDSKASKKYMRIMNEELIYPDRDTPQIIDSLLKLYSQNSDGKITPETIAKMRYANKNVLSELLKTDEKGQTSPEYENLIRSMKYVLGVTSDITEYQAHIFLSEELWKDDKRSNLASMIVGFMTPEKRAQFWREYKQTANGTSIEKFKKISGQMTLLELEQCDAETYKTLTEEDKKECEKAEEAKEYVTKLAKALAKDSIGGHNIGDEGLARLIFTLLEYASIATVAMNVIVNVKNLNNIHRSHLPLGLAGYGIARVAKGKVSITSKPVKESMAKVKDRKKLLEMLDNNMHTWHPLFEKTVFVNAFTEYINSPETKKENGELDLRKVNPVYFAKFLTDNAGKNGKAYYKDALEAWNKKYGNYTQGMTTQMKEFAVLLKDLGIRDQVSYMRNIRKAKELI